MKRICFISMGNLYLCPYLQSYLCQTNGSYTVIYWNREQLQEAVPGDGEYYVFRMPCQSWNKIKKAEGYLKYRRYVKRILEENTFDVVILLQTAASLLLSDLLIRDYSGRYIIDIRDYSYENFKPLYRREAKLIEQSLYTVISSSGYRAFLPPHDYLVVHNMRKLAPVQSGRIRQRSKAQDVLHIAFVGFVNYQEQHKKLMLLLKNDPRFRLSFIGTRAQELAPFCKAHEIRNVNLQGTFRPEEILDYYQDVDLINNLYGNHTTALDYALSNKLYFSAELFIPILTCPDTYMSEVAQKFGLGMVLDLDRPDAAEAIYAYYQEIDWRSFEEGCGRFLDRAREEQQTFEQTIAKVFEKTTAVEEQATLRVLHVLSELDGGGVERLLWDYYARMDRQQIVFDFAVSAKSKGILEGPFARRGCRIFHIPQMHDGIQIYCNALRQILDTGNYDIVHAHTGFKAFLVLREAKKARIPIRIAHAHQAFVPETCLEKAERACFVHWTKRQATHLAACGESAAVWMWGEKTFSVGNVKLIRNAIDVPAFIFSEETRQRLRKELRLNGKFVIGCVARLTEQKNHAFLLHIFKAVLNIRNDAVLLLVGRGELEEQIRAQVKLLGLQGSVIFLSVRNDVPALLNCMDVFVLPSLYEGLGIVFVEAQANGLQCFGTEETVPHEVALTDTMTFFSRELPAEKWAEAICKVPSVRNSSAGERVAVAGYDINREASSLFQYYKDLYDETANEK